MCKYLINHAQSFLFVLSKPSFCLELPGWGDVICEHIEVTGSWLNILGTFTGQMSVARMDPICSLGICPLVPHNIMNAISHLLGSAPNAVTFCMCSHVLNHDIEGSKYKFLLEII